MKRLFAFVLAAATASATAGWRGLVKDGYLEVAPKRLAALVANA